MGLFLLHRVVTKKMQTGFEPTTSASRRELEKTFPSQMAFYSRFRSMTNPL